MSNAEKMVEFLNGCHSAFQAVSLMEKELLEAGFIKLYENQNWQLDSNRYYFVTRNDSSIIAFKIPNIKDVKSINIVASHSDSPCFKVKPVSDFSDQGYTRLNVEVYGGDIHHTWLDRPLSLAGRVVIRENGNLVSHLLDFDEDMAMIPDMAIHQNREVNNGYKWNPQVDLIPMVGLENDEKFLLKKISDTLHVSEEDIMGYDLFLYNRQKGYVWGQKKEFISSPRLDDLACAYTSLQGFKNAYSQNAVNFFTVFDNEEVGSMTRQGMASSFLIEVIRRMFSCFFFNTDAIQAIMANSFMISADNAHAVHPNHPELFDRKNRAALNRGIVIKRNAAQSYVSDAVSEAVIRQLCDNRGIPYQFFANRSDMRGGGTQASISSVNLPSMAVDIGMAQLAMHSSFETCGSEDVEHMIQLFTEFYSSCITAQRDGVRITK